MITAYFGELRDGRLVRLAFLGYSLLLGVILFGFGALVVLTIVGAEKMIGGDLMAAQQALRETLGVPAVMVSGIVMLALFFMSLNISAKRARDIGLPGWLTMIAVAVVSILLAQYVSQAVANGFSGLVTLALLVVPSGMVSRS